MPIVHAFECGPVATMCYLVCNPALAHAYVVDAPFGCTQPVLEEAERQGCTVTDILLTHTHWDHTADCSALAAATGARVVVHAADHFRLIDPMAHTIWPLPFTITPVLNAFSLDGVHGVLELGGGQAPLRFIHTPGHTEGGICFVDDASRYVFAGDTLFQGSVGRVDLPGGDAATLLEAIRTRLFALPDDMIVFPGHGPTTTIGDERRANPYVGKNAE
ncbi:MAG TPA: MBL fold metallo-hydrolase [Candidatus Didemnitutus sp.]|nr:MBL fold metallo-hydrolase [Candidatus Didemnitutus sp.]